MKNRKARESGKAHAKSMVLIPLYRSRIEKGLSQIKAKRPTKADLMGRIDELRSR